MCCTWATGCTWATNTRHTKSGKSATKLVATNVVTRSVGACSGPVLWVCRSTRIWESSQVNNSHCRINGVVELKESSTRDVGSVRPVRTTQREKSRAKMYDVSFASSTFSRQTQLQDPAEVSLGTFLCCARQRALRLLAEQRQRRRGCAARSLCACVHDIRALHTHDLSFMLHALDSVYV